MDQSLAFWEGWMGSGRRMHWSEAHALRMGFAVPCAWIFQWYAILAFVAAVSFLDYVWRSRGHWTPRGSFGAANAITSLRLLAILFLGLFPTGDAWLLAGVAGGILVADGLDGWAARRWRLASPFGELFDYEVDAFFFLTLCFLLQSRGHLGAWILGPGVLRYLFVITLRWAGPLRPVRGNRFTRIVAVANLSALLYCLPAPGTACTVAATVASFALVLSFLYSFAQLYR
jgi:phosphatidylglycerophosphate synthase